MVVYVGLLLNYSGLKVYSLAQQVGRPSACIRGEQPGARSFRSSPGALGWACQLNL